MERSGIAAAAMALQAMYCKITPQHHNRVAHKGNLQFFVSSATDHRWQAPAPLCMPWPPGILGRSRLPHSVFKVYDCCSWENILGPSAIKEADCTFFRRNME